MAYGSASIDSEAPDVKKYCVPLMLLVRLVVDKSEHRKGLGKALLKQALFKSLKAAEVTGILAVIVYAKDESAKNFYQKFGFLKAPFAEYHLYLLFKDIANNLN